MNTRDNNRFHRARNLCLEKSCEKAQVLEHLPHRQKRRRTDAFWMRKWWKDEYFAKRISIACCSQGISSLRYGRPYKTDGLHRTKGTNQYPSHGHIYIRKKQNQVEILLSFSGFCKSHIPFFWVSQPYLEAYILPQDVIRLAS